MICPANPAKKATKVRQFIEEAQRANASAIGRREASAIWLNNALSLIELLADELRKAAELSEQRRLLLAMTLKAAQRLQGQLSREAE